MWSTAASLAFSLLVWTSAELIKLIVSLIKMLKQFYLSLGVGFSKTGGWLERFQPMAMTTNLSTTSHYNSYSNIFYSAGILTIKSKRLSIYFCWLLNYMFWLERFQKLDFSRNGSNVLFLSRTTIPAAYITFKLWSTHSIFFSWAKVPFQTEEHSSFIIQP